MQSIQNIVLRLVIRKKLKNANMATLPLHLHRKGMDRFEKMAKVPKGVSFEQTNCEGIPSEWAIPANLKSKGVILYLHGGAYAMGSIGTHRALTANIAIASKTKCLSINYRLAPENPYPCAIEDSIKAYNWLLQQGYKANKIVISGDSAGGGLAIATLLKLKEENIPLPGAAVCLSPWLDLENKGKSAKKLAKKDPMIDKASMDVFALHYATKEMLKDPLVSPLNGNFEEFPPIYIQVSESEILYDDTLSFEKKAKAEGVNVKVDTWKKTVHVWQIFAFFLPEAKKAIKKIGAYISTVTE